MLSKAVNKAFGAYRFVRTYGQHLPLAYEAIFTFRCKARLLAGTLKGSQEAVKLLYVGREKNYGYLVRMVFDAFQVVGSADATLRSCRTVLDSLAGQADVVIVDIGWPYHRLFDRDREYLEVPDWVNMALEVPANWEDVVAGFRHTTRNNDLRLIRRNRYRCEPASSCQAAENFYDSMYLPFVNGRHVDDPVVTPRKHVVRRAMHGNLLQILREDEIVVAGVVYPEGDVLYFLWIGVPEKFLDAPPEAAVSALYYFGIRHAFDNGCRWVDFTGTRAFLSDGGFRYKRKWGALVEDSFSPSSLLIKPRNGSRKAAIFCRQFPVLARRGDELEAKFVSLDETVDAETFRRLHKNFGCEGIERMTVIQIGDEHETRLLPDVIDDCECRLIKCPLHAFADHYVH